MRKLTEKEKEILLSTCEALEKVAYVFDFKIRRAAQVSSLTIEVTYSQAIEGLNADPAIRAGISFAKLIVKDDAIMLPEVFELVLKSVTNAVSKEDKLDNDVYRVALSVQILLNIFKDFYGNKYVECDESSGDNYYTAELDTFIFERCNRILKTLKTIGA